MSALTVIAGLVENGIKYAALFIPETIDEIFMMLGDRDSNIQTAAVKLVVALAPNIPHGIPIPETIQKIIRLLRRDERAMSALSALDTLASHEKFRSFVTTPQNLGHILQALTGKEDWDDQIVSFTERIISFGHNIPSITIALTKATLDGLPQMAPTVRKSYCRVISLLPLAAVPIPLENMQKLLVLLWNRDAGIANSAMEILICLTANAQFRKHILNPNFWKLTVKPIQHPPTSRQALKMITALAKYDDVRRDIIQSPDVANTLLTMLKSGTADIDRWEVGLKGLLVLGLFN
ncbi:hypothetical protein FB451DRAFT_1277758 [Mycena latifolia]|nr:hypothetical protein FB451DRAFT_1277758 [Mycena latifolia]